MFSQAAVTGLNDTGNAAPLTDWLDESLRYKLTNEIKSFELHGGPDFHVCDYCEGTGDLFPLFPQLQALLDNRICDPTTKQEISLLGQFIVAKEKVIARPRRIYEDIDSLLTAPKRHCIHEQKEPTAITQKWESTAEGPIFGHTVERICPTLFNCINEPELQQCMGRWSPMPGEKKEELQH